MTDQGGPVVRGRPPTPEQEVWLAAGEAMTPERSLEAGAALGRFVFSSVAVIGTVITGVGLAKPASGVLTPLTAVLITVSLVFAVVALTPTLGRVNPSDLRQVRRSYRRRITVRGVCAMLSAVGLAGAIVAAAWTGLRDQDRPVSSITAAITGHGANAKLSASVAIRELSHGSVAEVAVDGVTADDDETRLCSSVWRNNRGGSVTAACDVNGLSAYRQIQISTVVHSDGQRLLSGSSSLTVNGE
jgi:hypothetical protein